MTKITGLTPCADLKASLGMSKPAGTAVQVPGHSDHLSTTPARCGVQVSERIAGRAIFCLTLASEMMNERSPLHVFKRRCSSETVEFFGSFVTSDEQKKQSS